MLALLTQPATAAMSKKMVMILAGFGAIVLSATFLTWTYCLELNLKPWVEAGKRMNKISSQMDSINSQSKGASLAFMSLPRDYKGAGMIGRLSYLRIFCKPPLHAKDLSSLLQAFDFTGDNKKPLAQRLANLAHNRFCFIWDDALAQFVPWTESHGSSHFLFEFTDTNACQFNLTPADLAVSVPGQWQLRSPEEAYREQHTNFLRIYPSHRPVGLNFKPSSFSKLDPLKVQSVLVHCHISESDGELLTDQPNRPMKLAITWHNSREPLTAFEQPLRYLASDLFVAELDGNENWCLGGDITCLGLKFLRGSYVIDLYSLKAGSIGLKTAI
jgi:hypothetical protein